MRNLIISCAKENSYFYKKPKWISTSPNGNFMFIESLLGLNLINIDIIYVCFLKKHIDKYINEIELKEILLKKFKKKIEFFLIDNHTKNYPETIYKVIKHYNIKGSIFIKDNDTYFKHEIKNYDYICYFEIKKDLIHGDICNASYIEFNNLNEIINICEKKIISPFICVGGYSFKDSSDFIRSYEEINKLKILNEDLYISHIIFNLIINNKIFKSELIKDFEDWNKEKDWEIYKNKFKTLFIDLDGTLVHNSGEFIEPKWGTTEGIKKNVDFINNLYNTGKVKIIITTARKSEYKEKTIKQLNRLNIQFDEIIFDLYHSKRFLINDFSESNKYPTAVSINLKRNNDNLNDFIN